MKKMLKSKKGFKTILTVLAIMFIILVFIAFMMLFKSHNEAGTGFVVESFGAIGTEYELRAFLNSPSPITLKDAGLEIGNGVTNAQLIELTCANKGDALYRALSDNTKSYFNRLYTDKWRIILLYFDNNSNQGFADQGNNLVPISLGDELLEVPDVLGKYPEYNALAETGASEKLILYRLNIRGSKIGMQILPCKEENKAVKVILLHEKESLQIK